MSKKEADKKHDDDFSDFEDSMSDSEDEKAVDSVQVSKELQEHVIKYVKLDNMVKKKTEELAELKKQRKPSEEFILKEMEKLDESMIEIGDGKLRRNKSETKKALDQDTIKKAIAEQVKDPKIVDDIMKKMDASRPIVEHINLKRTSNRKAKPKGKK